jgi:hypothetical protein
MPTDKIKRLVRVRMARTDESYSVARQHILNSSQTPAATTLQSPRFLMGQSGRRYYSILSAADICGHGAHASCLLKSKLVAKEQACTGGVFREEIIQTLVPWIQNNFRILKRIRDERPEGNIFYPISSYGLKHVAENTLGTVVGGYVSNGEFIAAALRAGAPTVQIEDGHNALFGLSWKKPRIQVPKREGFLRWLLKQKDRDDPTGDLAQDAGRDAACRSLAESMAAWSMHLVKLSGAYGARDALVEAWKEYVSIYPERKPSDFEEEVAAHDGYDITQHQDCPNCAGSLVAMDGDFSEGPYLCLSCHNKWDSGSLSECETCGALFSPPRLDPGSLICGSCESHYLRD